MCEHSDLDPINEILTQIDIIKEKYKSKLDKHAQLDLERIEMAVLRLKNSISD